MLEIDDVCRALERSHPWWLTDKVADKYVQAIDLATQPNPRPSTAVVIAQHLSYLDDKQIFITESLRNQEDMFPGVLGAFATVVADVKTLARQQG